MSSIGAFFFALQINHVSKKKKGKECAWLSEMIVKQMIFRMPGKKKGGGRVSKKEQAKIRQDAATQELFSYCWVSTCYRFYPCPHHLPFGNPRNLATLLSTVECTLKDMHRERLIPCLLPLFQALQHEWAETAQLEAKDFAPEFDGAQEAAAVNARIEELMKQSGPQILAEFAPTQPLSVDHQREIAIAERRIAKQHAVNQHLSKLFLQWGTIVGKSSKQKEEEVNFLKEKIAFFEHRKEHDPNRIQAQLDYIVHALAVSDGTQRSEQLRDDAEKFVVKHYDQ